MTGASAEEASERACFYALLARLYYSGADELLLRRIAAAGGAVRSGATGDTPLTPGAVQSTAGDALPADLAARWSVLASACAAAGDEVRREYEDLFLGPGQSEVTLYLSHYWPEGGRQNTLVGLRSDLARYGIGRVPDTSEPEDHAAALFDLMRFLADGLAAPADPSGGKAHPAREEAWDAQKSVFRRYIAPAYPGLCNAISHHPGARFYRLVAGVSVAFLDLERRLFEED